MDVTRRWTLGLLGSALALPSLARFDDAQAVTPTFVKDGAAFRIEGNAPQPGGQSTPSLTVWESNGGFIASWLNYRSAADQRAFATFYSASGIQIFNSGGEMGNPSAASLTTGAHAASARPVSLPNGQSLIFFSADRKAATAANRRDVFVQRMNSGPWTELGLPLAVNQLLPNAQDAIFSARLSTGNSLTAFVTHSAAASTFDIKGRLVNTVGTGVGNELALTVNTTGAQTPTALAALTAAGASVLAYAVKTGARQDVYLQRLSGTGTRVGAPAILKTTLNANAYGGAGVAALPNGRYIALWFVAGASGTAVLKGKIFSTAGVAGPLLTIGATRISPTLPTVPKIAVAPDGSNIVVITDGFASAACSLEAWLLNAAGARQTGPIKLITNTQKLTSESLIRLSNGTYVMSWTQAAAALTATRAFAQRFRVFNCGRC
jgi:hypothetical protein